MTNMHINYTRYGKDSVSLSVRDNAGTIDLSNERGKFHVSGYNDYSPPEIPMTLFSSKEGRTTYAGSYYDDVIHIQGNGDFRPGYGKNTVYLYGSSKPLTATSRKIDLLKSNEKYSASNKLDFSNIEGIRSIEDLTFSYNQSADGIVIAKKKSKDIIATVALADSDAESSHATSFGVEDLLNECTMTFRSETLSYAPGGYSNYAISDNGVDDYSYDRDWALYPSGDFGWMI